MNTVTSQILPLEKWQRELARGMRNTNELLKILDISPRELPEVDHNAAFPLRVPLSYVARMNKGDPNDPLLRQILPLVCEQQDAPDFSRDPVGDLSAMIMPGLMRKYKGRVLLVTTGACAIHCRYCFRRHFPYSETHPDTDQWHDIVDYLAKDTSLEEVILSGGDPLTLSNRNLSSLTGRLADLTHLERLRIHTRLPVVLPARVDDGLMQWLGRIPFKTVMVIHANHPNEIDNDVPNVLHKLSQAGITLLNQTVLLRGINDDSSTLVRLSKALFEANVIPYYLHILDRVQGAAHFEVEERQARQLYQELLSELPGYLVPRLVREQTGSPFKQPLQCPDTG